MKKKPAIDVNRLLAALSEDDRVARDTEVVRFFRGVLLACLICSGFWALLGWFILSH